MIKINKSGILKIRRSSLLVLIVFFVFLLVALLLPNDASCLPVMGCILLLASFIAIIHSRESGRFLFIHTILAVVNVAVAYSNYFNYQIYSYNWQKSIIGADSHVIMGKVFLITYLTIIIGMELGCRITNGVDSLKQEEVKRLDSFYASNHVVYWIGVVILLLLFVFGFDRSGFGTYISQNNSFYEYAVVIFLFTWMFAPPQKFYKGVLLLYGVLYILQGLIWGDRSSALPMILLCFILISNFNVKPIPLLILSVVGIFGSNLIGIYRQGGFVLGENIISDVFGRLLYVDSVSYSFYSGVQIIRFASVAGGKITNFFSWLLSLFVGNTNQYSLNILARDYSNSFYNVGGGTSAAYFYFWFGIIGCLICGLIIGFFLGRIFSSNNKLCIIFQILIVVFALRWYVYYPQVLFRTCLVVPAIIYVIIMIFQHLLIRNKKVNLKPGSG